MKINLAEKQQALINDYIVVKDINGNVHITNRNNFKIISMNETYDNFGYQVNIPGGDDWFVTAWNWTDGANWHTCFLEEDSPDSFTELSENEQFNILQQFESASFSEPERGLSRTKTEDYMFVKSQFASDPWIASLE